MYTMKSLLIVGIFVITATVTALWPAASDSWRMSYTDPKPIASPVIAVSMEELPPLPKPFIIGKVNYNKQQRRCLALNIYHEAKNQTINGQIAVAIVTLNRVQSNLYPNNICDVIKQARYYKSGRLIRGKCQFSWWCDGKSDKPYEKMAWDIALYLSIMVLEDYRLVEYDSTDGSMWYHANYVKPRWTKKLVRTTTVDDHIFYKNKP